MRLQTTTLFCAYGPVPVRLPGSHALTRSPLGLLPPTDGLPRTFGYHGCARLVPVADTCHLSRLYSVSPFCLYRLSCFLAATLLCLWLLAHLATHYHGSITPRSAVARSARRLNAAGLPFPVRGSWHACHSHYCLPAAATTAACAKSSASAARAASRTHISAAPPPVNGALRSTTHLRFAYHTRHRLAFPYLLTTAPLLFVCALPAAPLDTCTVLAYLLLSLHRTPRCTTLPHLFLPVTFRTYTIHTDINRCAYRTTVPAHAPTRDTTTPPRTPHCFSHVGHRRRNAGTLRKRAG